MTSVTSRKTSGVNVVLDRVTAGTASTYINGLSPWINLTTDSATGWVVDTSGATEGTYSAANRRSYLESVANENTATTNLTFAYSAAGDNGASGAQRWGLPRLGGAVSATRLITVFAPASL